MKSHDSLSELLRCWRVSPVRDPGFTTSVLKRIRDFRRVQSVRSENSNARALGEHGKGAARKREDS